MARVIIHGVHRSGTSLTASFFARAGFWYAEPEYQMHPQADNPKGFWERTDVVELNDKILADLGLNWFTLTPKLHDKEIDDLARKFKQDIKAVARRLDDHNSWFLKDPRFSVTWPLWSPHLEPSHHIVLNRHPESVAMSLSRRNHIDIDQGLIFWYHQTRMIASALLGETNVTNIEFGTETYSGSESIELVNNIAAYTDNHNINLSRSDIETLYEPKLIHHHSEQNSGLDGFPLIARAWELVRAGNYQGILSLPEIQTSDCTWQMLDSRESVGCQMEISRREVEGLRGAIKELQAHDNKLSKELKRVEGLNNILARETEACRNEAHRFRTEVDTQRQRLEVCEGEIENYKREVNTLTDTQQYLTEEKDELNLRLLKIAGEIKGYMSSKRYLVGTLCDKVLRRSKLSRNLNLNAAYDIAVYEQSNSQLEAHLPTESNRILFLKALYRNPLSFIRRINAKRVTKGINVVLGKQENDAGINQALIQHAIADIGYDKSLEILDGNNPGEWINSKLEFNSYKEPQVSIVIPVYNNYKTTLACLHSIRNNTNDSKISYEVVVADDCSNDETRYIENVVNGIRVVREENNLGFLKNCNSAIPKTNGQFIVLLNNDTNVQSGWLEELLLPFDEHSDVGVTGPMFLYPDGRVQEAGGIVFSNAAGWNYGRLDSPDKPEYNFSREVDYVSGACLVFRRGHWDKVGGFDKTFTPAYYEDTDFCFETRKQGFRVYYVPTSKVVHFEGVSHGSSEESGIKKFQAVNRDKFLKKWKDELASKHYSGSEHLFAARCHGKGKKTLLFIDHYVPFYDKDAGSKVAQRYIELLVKEGVHVIFMGDNFYPHQPYTHDLQALGVEVLHGEFYKNNWYQWLQENSKHIDTIYLNRPHISIDYIDKIRSLEHVPRIAYHGADLHYVRVAREESLGISSGDGMSSEDWKEIEFDIMRKCDVSLWLSENEVQLIRSEDDSLNVAYKPMYWFEDSFFNSKRMVEQCKQLLFVGGFGHPPNRDGLEWFLDEIYPSVLAKHPDCTLTVIGSNCPDEIMALASENLNILGYVSEKELRDAYSRARIAVVPLRYGAGVKGKVIESMQYGVPVMTTTIGAEGLPGEAPDFLSVADSAITFAAELNELLDSDELCKIKIDGADKILKKYFSMAAAEKAVSILLPENSH